MLMSLSGSVKYVCQLLCGSVSECHSCLWVCLWVCDSCYMVLGVGSKWLCGSVSVCEICSIGMSVGG